MGLKEIEKHVLDDAVELIATIGLANPLNHTNLLLTMPSERQVTAEFLRATLSRHVILIATRLHEEENRRRDTEIASIEAYLTHAVRENQITDSDAVFFRQEREAIKGKLEAANIPYSDLVAFRHSELAHSLHRRIPLTNKLISLPVFDFAQDTFELVLKIEKRVSNECNLDSKFQLWLDRGNAFWSEGSD